MKTLRKIKNLFKRYFPKFFSSSETIVEDSIKEDIIWRASLVTLSLTICALLLLIRIISLNISTPKYRVSKNIKIDLVNAILINCDYEDLKIIYDKKERIDIRKHFIKDDEFYDRTVDLVYILEDMVFDYYTNKSKDSLYISRLKQFIIESKETDPFDKLNESQKELFIALRENSGDSYQLIKENLVRISEELFSKNETIERYLDKSNQSFIISLIALAFTIFQLIPQIKDKLKHYLNKKKK